MIIGFMVMSVISSVFAVLFFFGSIYWNIVIVSRANYIDNISTVEAFVYSFVTLFFAETVVSIWSAAICCHAVCCGRRERGAVIRQDYVPLHSHPSVMTTIQGPLQAGGSTDVSQISFSPPPVY
ncbi:hypothetical protein LSAT2_013211 [Lamellibrachia satsuma]|nr:hypothetical protein LSAT2_013211 [Lamellibrachia satsuma]